jgi:hypothetical protein
MWTRSYIRCRCEYKHKTQTGDSVRKAFLSHPDGSRTQSCNARGTHLWTPRAIPCGWERRLKFEVRDVYCAERVHLAMRDWRGVFLLYFSLFPQPGRVSPKIFPISQFSIFQFPARDWNMNRRGLEIQFWTAMAPEAR